MSSESVSSHPPQAPAGATQRQFLDVISRDEAVARFQRHLRLSPLGRETVPLGRALHRVLADDLISAIDVPGFDRSNVDGFAVRAADTFEASEERPRSLRLNAEHLSPGVVPHRTVLPGTATPIATGGMLPRGADAVVMMEHAELLDGDPADESTPPLAVHRAVAAGDNVTFAGADVARGETVLRSGQTLTSREIGVIAALGAASATVFRRPRVAILSTGDEIVAPGEPAPVGSVYDSNQAILAAAVEEAGGEAVPMGIVPDDESKLTDALRSALSCDVVLLSGGTSKGDGDLSYRVVGRLPSPGIVAHGVALKPGKPICLAVTGGKPVVILPGFPTSAIFTFHEFVAPVIRAFAGRRWEAEPPVLAKLPMRVNSERGRTEYLLVRLFQSETGLAAYPMGKGSGSVTTFSQADGYLTIPQQTEQLESGTTVEAQPLGKRRDAAELVAIGSHCLGLDFLLSELHRAGWSTKSMHVGSTGGLAAVRRNECDLAGVHLLDEKTGLYNAPFLTPDEALIPGYRRRQCFVFRPDDLRFAGRTLEEAFDRALGDPECVMVNRNAGSGTRIVIDQRLGGRRPAGYAVQPRSHHAVAAAVLQQRADWGVATQNVAALYGLASLPIADERYDFLVPVRRFDRPAVAAFRALLTDPGVRARLTSMGFLLDPA